MLCLVGYIVTLDAMSCYKVIARPIRAQDRLRAARADPHRGLVSTTAWRTPSSWSGQQTSPSVPTTTRIRSGRTTAELKSAAGWTGRCTCPRAGPAMGRGCRRWGWHPTRPSRPSRNGRNGCWNGSWRPELSVAWVVGDMAYGRSTKLRCWLEDRGPAPRAGHTPQRVTVGGPGGWIPEAVHAVHGDQACRGSVPAPTAKGNDGTTGSPECGTGGCRHGTLPALPAFPVGPTLVAVAGSRWTIEHAFEAVKQETGLDDYEMRGTVGWYRHVTLVPWNLALLAVVRSADLVRSDSQKEATTE